MIGGIRQFGRIGASLWLALALAGVASAQNGYPPGQVPGAYGAPGSDTANLLVRIDRLENRIRSMTGQIEQLQFQMRRMQQQLEAFQKDVDFRLRENAGAKPARDRRSDVLQPTVRDAPAGEPKRTAQTNGDVFNPAANPNAPGAPRQLGSPGNVASQPLPGGPISPDDQNRPDRENVPDPDTPINLSRPGALPAPPVTPPAPRPDASPRETYNIAVAAMKNRRYEDAEQSFKILLARHPDSSLADDALYNLGITYASRGRHREAAEQFLKVTTDHKKSRRAPESLYRLGLALERLGAREQACASYAEVERRYPLAPGSLRTRVERQMRRAKC